MGFERRFQGDLRDFMGDFMEVFVGKSGWYYDWNENKNLDWFIQNSGLNTVELNASYYRGFR